MARRLLFALVLVAVAISVIPAQAATLRAQSITDNTPTLRHLTFPVAGYVTYSNDWGACRSGCARHHEGNDLLGHRLEHELAANDGVISWAHLDNSGSAGNMLELRGNDGWAYWYIHINNDTPGTDDGANPKKWILAPGVHVGSHVKAGEFIAYMGDSGDAETTTPHLHFELHRPGDIAVDPYYSLRLSQGLTADPFCAYSSNPKPHPSTKAGHGYWLLGANGTVSPFGGARPFGDASTTKHSGTVLDLAPTPTGKGYWIATNTGQVLPFGDAKSFGDLHGVHLNAPMIGMNATPDGKGYWLFASDGGVFSFGEAVFHGSTGGKRLNSPVVGMAVSATGKGYWLFARDGGIFTFGDSVFYGSAGGLKLNAPIIGMVRSASGHGYLLLGGDGGTFNFGDAHFYGSLPGFGMCKPQAALDVAPTRDGRGYWLLDGTGNVRTFGDAFAYHDPSTPPVHPIALAVLPR